MNRAIPFLWAICLFSSCSPAKEKLTKVWFFISSETATKTNKAKGNLPEDLSGISFLNFEADGKYTAYFSAFEYGRWLVNSEDEIILENYKKQERILPIKKLNKEELVFTINNQEYYF